MRNQSVAAIFRCWFHLHINAAGIELLSWEQVAQQNNH